MRTLTWRAVWARRLARHALLERATAPEIAAVAGAVCGIHAQMLPAAELSLGIRLAGVTRRDIQAALWDGRTLVKTYGIRGTLHLFPATELPLWLAALRTRETGDAEQLARLELDAGQLETLVAAIGEALDGRCLTLRQLGDAVVARAGAWAGEQSTPVWGGTWPRWRRALGTAALAGRLCYGPDAGREVTFVRPDQWLGGWHEVDPGLALAEVFRRYLRAYGPATPRDFAQWFALQPRDARALAASLAGELEEVDVEGDRGFLLAADAEVAAEPEPESVHLLPHFDCYMIGCHPRERLFPELKENRAVLGVRPGPVPLLLVDGVVAGVWERRAVGRRIAVGVAPFTPLDARQQQQLDAEVARIGAFLEAETTLTIGPIAVRPHL